MRAPRPAVLPRANRITRAPEFRLVLRRGRRAGRRCLVVHVLAPASPSDAPSRAGLVVGRTVGPSVVRHRVSRRLRHLLRERLPALPSGTEVVVRAQPAAAGASSAELGADLDAALARLGLGAATGPQDSRGLKR